MLLKGHGFQSRVWRALKSLFLELMWNLVQETWNAIRPSLVKAVVFTSVFWGFQLWGLGFGVV